MDVKELSKPLDITDLEFRVQSINKGKYATILPYKDARVDMNRLDEVCTPLGWKREHTRDNMNCIVSIWDFTNKQWVSKEDTGTESMAEAEKGLASDSFKRACFNWGIGREIYSYPIISVKLFDSEVTEYNGKLKASFNFKLKEWTWDVVWKDGDVESLVGKDQNGGVRYTFPKDVVQPIKTSPKKADSEKPTLTDEQYAKTLASKSVAAITKVGKGFNMTDIQATRLRNRIKEIRDGKK